MAEIKTTDALAGLDPIIKKWIQSDGVFQTILALNKELGCYGEELSVISQLIISVSLREVKPENVAAEIAKGLPFLEDKQIEKAAETIKKKIFYPLSAAFKKYGIDTEKISTAVPASAPAIPAAREVKMERPAPSWQPTSGIEVRQPQMTDVKKPEVVPTPKPFGLSESIPKAPFSAPSGASQGKPPSAPAPQPVPIKSEPHEIEKYEDQHPVKED